MTLYIFSIGQVECYVALAAISGVALGVLFMLWAERDAVTYRR